MQLGPSLRGGWLVALGDLGILIATLVVVVILFGNTDAPRSGQDAGLRSSTADGLCVPEAMEEGAVEAGLIARPVR